MANRGATIHNGRTDLCIIGAAALAALARHCRRGSSLTTAKSNYESTYHRSGIRFHPRHSFLANLQNHHAFLSNCSYFSLLLLTSLIAILPYSPITTLALWGAHTVVSPEDALAPRRLRAARNFMKLPSDHRPEVDPRRRLQSWSPWRCQRGETGPGRSSLKMRKDASLTAVSARRTTMVPVSCSNKLNNNDHTWSHHSCRANYCALSFLQSSRPT